jgi:hypothetical protein
MPISFPAGPSLNQTYTYNGKTWKWNGTGWVIQPGAALFQAPLVSGTNIKTVNGQTVLGSGNLLVKDPRSITVENPTSSENIPIFYTTVALVISSIRGVVKGTGSPSVTYSVKSASDLTSGSPAVHANAITVTNTTTGANATLSEVNIAANSWVWLETSATGGTVTGLNVTLAF